MSNENKNTNVKEETTWTNFKFFNNQVKLKVIEKDDRQMYLADCRFMPGSVANGIDLGDQNGISGHMTVFLTEKQYFKRATDGMSIDDFNSALSRIRNDVDKLRLKSKRASSELLHLNESIAAESIRMETVLKAADFNRLDKTKVSMLIESVYVHKRDPKSGTQAIDITWKF